MDPFTGTYNNTIVLWRSRPGIAQLVQQSGGKSRNQQGVCNPFSAHRIVLIDACPALCNNVLFSISSYVLIVDTWFWICVICVFQFLSESLMRKIILFSCDSVINITPIRDPNHMDLQHRSAMNLIDSYNTDGVKDNCALLRSV